MKSREQVLLSVSLIFGVLYLWYSPNSREFLSRFISWLFPFLFVVLSKQYVSRKSFASLFVFLSIVTLLQIYRFSTGFKIAEFFNRDLVYLSDGIYSIQDRLYLLVPPGLGLPVKNTYLLLGFFPFTLRYIYFRWVCYILLVLVAFGSSQVTLLFIVLIQPLLWKLTQQKEFPAKATIGLVLFACILIGINVAYKSLDFDRYKLYVDFFKNIEFTYFMTGWFNEYFQLGIDQLPHNLFLNAILIGGVPVLLLVLFFIYKILQTRDGIKRLSLLNILLLMMTHNRSFLFDDNTWLWILLA